MRFNQTGRPWKRQEPRAPTPDETQLQKGGVRRRRRFAPADSTKNAVDASGDEPWAHPYDKSARISGNRGTSVPGRSGVRDSSVAGSGDVRGEAKEILRGEAHRNERQLREGWAERDRIEMLEIRSEGHDARSDYSLH